MAVQDGYGKTSGSESLVFAYDLKDTINSFRGEPTTNQANTDYARTIQFHNQGGYNNAGTISEAPEKGPDWKKITITDRGTNFRIAQFPYIVQNYGTTKVYSVEYDFGSTSGYFFYGDGSSGFGVLQDDGKRVTARFTPPYATDWYEALFLGHNTPASNINDTIYYRNYQVEEKSYPTRYTPTSRSATQGLLDLTGNSSINLSDVSFDSNSQLTFDGTNDKITINCTGLGVNTYNSTTEFIIQLPYYSGGQRCIMSYRGNSGGDLYIGKGSNGIFSYYNSLSNPAYTVGYIADGAIAHVAVVCDATNNLIKHYINGSLTGSASRTGWVSSNHTSFTLGYDPGGTNEYMDGKMYKFAHYNRVLTTTEITNNYLKYKRQYGLT